MGAVTTPRTVSEARYAYGSHKKPVVKMAESIENTGFVRKQR